MEYAQILATVHAFEKAMTEKVADEEASELFAEFKLPAPILAQIIMQHLVIPEMNTKLPTTMKAFWMEVAEHMGPDWISEFRNVGDFMDKVDNF